jgi:hypothetical protein
MKSNIKAISYIEAVTEKEMPLKLETNFKKLFPKCRI